MSSGGGKTTACANLATIAHSLNLGAGIADADPQGSSCDWRRARGNNDVRVRPSDPDHLEECVELARQAGLQWLFVDMPPGSRHALAASRVADLTLILTRPTFFDVRVTEHVIDLVHSTPSHYGIVINAAPPRRNGEDSTMVRDTREALAAVRPRLWPRQITHRLAVPSAVISGKGVIEIDPNSLAAQEYCALWNAIVAEIQKGRSHQ
jgi:chromosome partitioning protein